MTYVPVFQNKFTLTGIDAKVAANSVIFTNNGSSDFVISNGIIRCTAASGITSGPSIGLGSAAGVNDIFSSVSLLALTVAGRSFGFSLIGMSITIPAGGSIYVNLTAPATGTSQTVCVDIEGYWT